MKSKNISRQSQLDNLLYSTSQYDDNQTDQIRRELTNAQHRFIQNNMLNLDEDQDGQGMQAGHDDQDDDGVVLGPNGDSMDDGVGHWGADDRDDGQQWNNQQNAKYYFREAAGNSQNFSQSMSIHRHDLLQSKGMQENSMNLDSINIQNILKDKKKEQQKVNEVLNIQINDLIDKIQKQQCLIKGYKQKIENLEQNIESLRQQNQQMRQLSIDYHGKLERKDQVFNILKQRYTEAADTLKLKQQSQQQLKENVKSMDKQIQKLRNIIKSFNDQGKGLLDFNNLTPRRSESLKSTATSFREIENMEAEIQKLKRQKKVIQTEYEITKDQVNRKQEKYRNLQQEHKRKVSLKEKKIKELSQQLEQNKQEIFKIRKSNDNNSSTYKDKLIKIQKEMGQKQERIKQLESKVKMSIDQIKKKQQKIKELLVQMSDKNKKLTELRDTLQQEQARNQIQSRIQKQRDNQIDKLENQVKELKTQKFNLKRDLQNLEKPSNIEQKLKKQIANLKKDNENLTKQISQLTQSVNSFEKQSEAKDEKLRQLKKKHDDISKKSALIKKKSEQSELVSQQVETYKQMISKMSKQIGQLRKKLQHHQQVQNKLLILESRLRLSNENNMHNQDVRDNQNQYDLEDINQALQEQLEEKDMQIEQLKKLHQKQINRLMQQKNTMSQIVKQMEKQMGFRQKSLDYMHVKMVQMQKENAGLKANHNILHSSFYDQSYAQQQIQAIRFYQNKVASLQKKIQTLNIMLKQKDILLKKTSDREGSSFEISQLKNRIKDLQSMAIANEQSRKIAPQSLSHEETIQFLMKLLKRIIKSSQMLRSLSKMSDFKTIINNLWRVLDK